MIINFGSINVDHVYRVPSLPKPGETLAAKHYDKFLGGKGINQSIAISKSGGEVTHVGAVGSDGDWALSQIQAYGVEISNIATAASATGHAIIYVDDRAENQIVIEGGANQQLQKSAVEKAVAKARPESDWVLLQNETNLADYIVSSASKRNVRIAYAAAPFVAETTLQLLPHIHLLIVNEGEANALAMALQVDAKQIPVPELLITRGSEGADFFVNGEVIHQPAFSVDAIDTTGAGDTFTGSFLALYSSGKSAASALHYAAAASAIQVTRAGAAAAIPAAAEVQHFLDTQ